MQISFISVILGLAAISSAAIADVEGVRHAPRDSIIMTRQSGSANGNRPTPSGACCVANTSLKQDTCTATDGTQGRCVPGGNDCGGSLSCVAQSKLTCDAAIIERGKSLCRANAGNGQFIDGAKTISSLSQASVN
ncbi:hypothetical protein PFICI_13876 [Pestalotiopsis fici W106-1]|uniref:Uncharacterized protein n=1 Tax=Pestalotiopsis fici (strain W106-1 / CGMCC3.15140) TaxID=1229662 RepID=W3WJA2_PESFW|nr:uncharacterized protein PFICI_13876 [Pestalotiopsis fici W106-1]ETS74010.1 hypothetical protein PFICI_13876 [Pestalotiopsis fici W106-1]